MDFFVNWLSSTPMFSVPLILAALGLIINERAGVINLGAEGIMLCGALFCIIGFFNFFENIYIALIVGALAGAFLSVIFAVLVVIFRTNQVVTGVTFVFLGYGLTGLIGINWVNKTVPGIETLEIPILYEIPVIGRIFFNHDFMIYLTIIFVFLLWYFINRTRSGLILRAVGENPEAVDANGHNVLLYRFFAVVVGGFFIGLAGSYLSLASAKIFVFEMTQGRGWIAIALVIFARWIPLRVVLGGILFGSIEALIPRVMAAGIPLPQYYLLMTPYLATLFVLIYAAVRYKDGQETPSSLGIPYIRQDRT